jgi:hypothetical protein
VAAEHLIGPPQTETIRCAWDQYDVTQEQSFYAVAIADVRVSLSGLDQIEQATTLGHRWWTAPLPTHSGQAALEDVVPNIDAVYAARRLSALLSCDCV